MSASLIGTEYSVLLLYPDYMADNYGQDTYYTSVHAAGPLEAITLAQQEVVAENAHEQDDDMDPDDFVCLLVIEGVHPAVA